MEIPEHLPVMILPECNLFPHALLPLHIFEKPYRQIVDYSLQHHRLFCVGMAKGYDGDGECHKIYPHLTVGLIRACVRNADSTYNLVLQGLQRGRLCDWVQIHPFRMAEIELIESKRCNRIRTIALSQKVVEIARSYIHKGSEISVELENYLRYMSDPEMISDVVGYNFIPDAVKRQRLLAMKNVDDRLHYIITELSKRSQATSPSSSEIV